jgi:protein-S-isoprenylcysteine O-methyltransferase Ste14
MQNRIPPPVLALLSLLLMVALDRYWPLATWLSGPARMGGFVLVALAAAVVITAMREFKRASTTVNPLRPESATSLVTSGVFAYTRNPMYLGLALVLAGCAIRLGTVSAWVGPALFVALVSQLQIVPEERALEKLFGERYAAYCRQTGRWWGRRAAAPT